MNRYLVIETAYLGDVIISLGVAHAIKLYEPDAHITYLVRPDARTIALASPDVDHVTVFDKRGDDSGLAGITGKAQELNALGFNTVIALHSSDRTRKLVGQLGASTKVGFAGALDSVLTQTVQDSGWKNRYQRALLPLKLLYGETLDLSILPRILGTKRADIENFCDALPRVVSVAPGSAWTTKQWPPEYYAKLCQRLVDQGIGVIVAGGPEETQIGLEITRFGDRVLNMAGNATLLEAAFAISRSKLLIGNDSSPTHLAIAVGTPTLTLFGPTVPEFGFAAPESLGESMGIDLWCRPCTPHGSSECPVHTHACMRELTVDAVYQKAVSMLAPQPVAPESF